jgi:alkylated DNA repair dioxygenase AlkB
MTRKANNQPQYPAHTFPPGKQLLARDGDALLFPSVFDEKASAELFQQLHAHIPWEQHYIRLFGKKVAQPRLSAWYGDPGTAYTYSGLQLEPLAWNSLLLQIKMRLEEVCPSNFTSVLLNLYRDGQDYMGWHRDNETELGVQPVIASLSFGAERRFVFRHFRDEQLRVAITLSSGSLLVMKGDTQQHWQHQLPKSAKVLEPRINLTFRKIV